MIGLLAAFSRSRFCMALISSGDEFSIELVSTATHLCSWLWTEPSDGRSKLSVGTLFTYCQLIVCVWLSRRSNSWGATDLPKITEYREALCWADCVHLQSLLIHSCEVHSSCVTEKDVVSFQPSPAVVESISMPRADSCGVVLTLRTVPQSLILPLCMRSITDYCSSACTSCTPLQRNHEGWHGVRIAG